MNDLLYLQGGVVTARSPDIAHLLGRRVLLVEDQAIIALDVERVLGELGCTVLGPVPSVAEALDLIERGWPDVALLDLELLDGRATPIAKVLAGRGVPFVLMTGYSESASELADPALAGAPRLLKPFGEDELEAVLARALAEA